MLTEYQIEVVKRLAMQEVRRKYGDPLTASAAKRERDAHRLLVSFAYRVIAAIQTDSWEMEAVRGNDNAE